MANTVSRLSSNGTLILAGNLDEVTFNSTSTANTNLLSYTNTMTIANGWSYGSNTTFVSSTSLAPDGTYTAVNTTGNGSGGNEYVSRIVTYKYNTYYTASIYARLANGPVPTSGTIISTTYSFGTGNTRATVNFAGNLTTAWQRFSVTFLNVTPGSYAAYFIADQNNNSNIEFWGAQIEEGTVATVYQPVTTSKIGMVSAQKIDPDGKLYVKNIFDEITYNKNSNVVPVNLASYSQDLDNAVWGKYQGSISPNVMIAPDGTLTADKWVENALGGVEHFYYKGFAFVNTTLTGSLYLKAGERNRVVVSFSNFVNATGGVAFDLITGTIISTTANSFDFTNTSGTITNVGNGWFRCTVTTTKIGFTNTSANFQIALVSTGTTTTYTGDGSSGLYAWGHQVELGSVATDYIPMSAAGVMTTPRFAQRTTSNGINYVTSMFDEFTSVLPVTDGIIMNLDPSYDSSYSGTGNTWYDASNKKNDAKLVNGIPTYSTNNGGILKFSGAFAGSIYANTAFPTRTFTPSSNRTLSIWVKFHPNMKSLYAYHPRPTYTYGQIDRGTNDTYGSCGGLVSCSWYGDYGLNWYYYRYNNVLYFSFESHTRVNTPTYSESSPGYTVPIADAFDKWYNVVGSYSTSLNQHVLYVNGVAVNTYTTAALVTTGSPFNYSEPTMLVARNNIGGGNCFDTCLDGDVGQVLIYNRALTAAEVLQNYNALKNRYAV